jgi:O-Antigen ligase
VLTEWPFGKGVPENPVVFKNYITQGIFLSLAAYFLAVQLVHHHTRWRWLYSVGVLLILYNIVYMTQGRTGYLILASLILLLMYQLYHTRGLWLGVILVTFLSLFAYQTSDKVYERIEKVSTGFQDYAKGEETSVPMRISFIKNSVMLITQHPLLGAGTGSFSHQYEQLARPQGIKTTANPHNEYLMIAVQWGLLGTGVFISLLYQLLRTSFRLTSPYGWMAQGLVMTMAVGCLFNSFLLDTTEGHLFAYLVGLFWGELPLQEEVQRAQDSMKFRGVWQLSLSPDRVGQLLTLIAAVVPVLWVYQMVIMPTLSHKSLLLSNDKVIPSLLEAIQQRPSPFSVPFETTLQTSQGLHLSVFAGEEMTLTTRIQVAPHHIGKSAYVVIIGAYQPPHSSATETIWLQRRHPDWVPLDRELLRTEQYYPQLPENLEVPIYQGKLLLAGTVTVYVGYLLEDNSFIFNDKRIQLEIIKNEDHPSPPSRE